MRQTIDISSAANIIRQDLEDTNSKLFLGMTWLQVFGDFVDLSRIYDGHSCDQQYFNDLVSPYIEFEPEASDWSTGISVIMSQGINIKRNIEKFYSSNTLLYKVVYYMRFTGYNGVNKTIICYMQWDNGSIDSWLTVDNQQVDLNTYVFDAETISDNSLCSYITKLKESVQCNEFLSDIVNVLKTPSSYTLTISKWLGTSNISTSVKNAIDSAIKNINGSPQSILVWLQTIYEQMTSASTIDDEITFSTTDYIVRYSFATIATTAISAIATVVASIVFVVNKIVGAIAFALVSLGQVFVQAWQNRTNPLITLKQDVSYYDDFLPIPILQDSINYNGNHVISSSDDTESKNLRYNTFLMTFRVFRNKGIQQDTKWEGFLRCPIGPQTLCNIIASNYSTSEQTYRWVRTGFLGMNGLFYDVSNSDDLTGFEIGNMPKEKNQAIYVLLHLLLVYSFFGDYATPSSDSGLTCYNAIRNDTATTAQLLKFFNTMAVWCIDRISANNVFDAFYTDFGSSILSYDINWGFVINHLIPLIRSKIHINDSQIAPGGISYIKNNDVYQANEHEIDIIPRPYDEAYCSTWIAEAIQQSDSPYVIPRYTSDGFLRNLILTVVAIAAVTAVSIALIVSYKKIVRRISTSKVAKLSELKAFNDEVQTDPSYSKADKKAAFDMYDKAVRSYNRTSWLWGGGTWSATNGWLDYNSTDASSSAIADSIKSTLSDQIMEFSSVDPLSNMNSSIDISSDLPSIGEETDSISSKVDGLVTLISGV